MVKSMETRILLLLVEDEPMILDMMSEALSEGGYSVLTAGNGEAAIKALRSTEQQLSGLVTDVNLGAGCRGWEVAREARRCDPLLPVVYVTGDSAHQWAIEGVPKSVLLQKPVACAQVITAISSLLNEANSGI